MTAFKWGKMLGGRGRRDGFLARLRRDQKGNTLAIMAAALIPMIGMVGSAVDISRAYLVKTRLQQACDAGVLAARRTMTGQSIEATSNANAKTQATNFFNINLRNGAYGATVTSIVVTDVKDSDGNATGTVHGVASADVPTSLMKIFGKPKLTMNVSCEAELQVSNNDVMFVLDVTGSMNCPAATPSCSNNGGVEADGSKIDAVRSGVVDFYDTLAAATTAEARLRIGFMPYSSDVNVGKLLPADYIVDNWTYQSRQPNFYSVSSTSSATETYGSSIDSSDCDDFGRNRSFSGFRPSPSGSTVETNVTSTSYTRITYAFKDWGATSDTSGTDRTCRRTATTTNYVKDNVNGTVWHDWDYKQISYNVSGYKTGGTLTTQTGDSGTSVTSTWNGCIEERQTVANATFSSIPSDAYDLQIDLVPTSDLTRWKPSLSDVVYGRSGTAAETGVTINSSGTYSHPTGDVAACPKQAQKLAVMTHDQVADYVKASNGFKATGGTYHDVGMLWGGRFLSPTGIFSGENTTAPNGEPINRNIIFMTDGAMAPQTTIYSLYGFEKIDRRVSGVANTPNNTDLTSRHLSRFSAICEAIKSKNITIWVVAYDQTMTTELQNCASPGKSFYAANDTQMKAALKTIAQQIAELRLSR